MIFEFVNGNDQQQTLWKEALGYLLNLPLPSIALEPEIEFVPSLTGENATAFAETEWDYNARRGTIRVRNDAPGYADLDAGLIAEAASMGLSYNAIRHFHETAVHETGHAVFASLSEEFRLKIVELFGVDTDDPAVLQPEDKEWRQRIGEGIAETFKEAFLPARYRVFPNRTNRRIPYSLFPKFRAIIRAGLTGGNNFSYIYGDDYPWKVDLGEWAPHEFGDESPKLPTYLGDRDPEAFVFYEEFEDFAECWGIDMSQFPESGEQAFSIRPPGGIET